MALGLLSCIYLALITTTIYATLHPPPGLLTRYEYNAVLGQHVVLMDTHLDIDSLECETTSAFPDSDSPPPRVEARDSAHVSSRKNPKQPPLTQPLLTEPKPAPPLEKAHSKNDFSLEIEVRRAPFNLKSHIELYPGFKGLVEVRFGPFSSSRPY